MLFLDLSLLVSLLVPAGDESAAWNRYRGPNGTGLAEGGPYPIEIGPDSHVLWKRALPPGRSSPVLSHTHVYVTAVEDERLWTLALERDTGELAWKREAPRPRRTHFHPKNGPAAPTPAVDSEVVVVFFDEFGLLAYDHAGEELWRLPLGPFDNIYGMGSSPILVGGLAVLACDQSTGSYVLAVSKRDGKEVWRVPRPEAVSGACTPIVYRPAEDGPQVVLPGSLLLDAYDAASGARVWWITGLPSEMKSVPVLLDDTLWLHGYNIPMNDHGQEILLPEFPAALAERDADGDGRISAAELGDGRLGELFAVFDLVADGSLDAGEWGSLRATLAATNAAMAVRPGGRGDRTAEAVLWRFYRSIPQLPSPLVVDGRYYMLNDQGGLISLLDAASGELIERGRLEDALDEYYASPVGANGRVYLLSESGILSVLAGDSGLRSVHRAEFGESCYATPALEDGRIWLRTQEHLYAFGAE